MRVCAATSSRLTFFASRAARSWSPTVGLLSNSSLSVIRSVSELYCYFLSKAGRRLSTAVSANRDPMAPCPVAKRLAEIDGRLLKQGLDAVAAGGRVERADHRLDRADARGRDRETFDTDADQRHRFQRTAAH